jgi:SAM-dependent methyltransferase
VHDVAHEYPEIEIVGIDISQRMIAYAQAHAKARKLPNAHFQVMDALKPLNFPDGSFDLVNTRTIMGFVSATQWPLLIEECKRILRLGGVLRITEGETGFSNMAAYETLWGLINKAFSLTKRSFSPTGVFSDSTVMLRRLLQRAGFEHTRILSHVLDYSTGNALHDLVYQDMKVAFKLLYPFVKLTGDVTQEEFDDLYERAMKEMESNDFCALGYLLTAWGTKPTEVAEKDRV